MRPSLLQRHHLNGDYKPTDFFETAAMLITLVLMGKYLESAVSADGMYGAGWLAGWLCRPCLQGAGVAEGRA